jgi:hypothetical protein
LRPGAVNAKSILIKSDLKMQLIFAGDNNQSNSAG